MKKLFWVLMIAVLIFTCCSCAEKNTFVEGNLLYDLGAESFEDIEKVEFMYEEYQGYYSNKLEITNTEDIKMLCNYMYSSNYPNDKLHELFLFPNNTIYVTIKGIEYQLRLGDEGELTVATNNSTKFCCTYKAENGKGITSDIWNDLILKY